MKATRISFGEKIIELGKKNEKIIVLDADLGSATKTEQFSKEIPEQFINVGIAEQNMIGIATGLSKMGYIPIASSFAIFSTSRAHEIIRNSVCYQKANVKIMSTHAGITVGFDGGSHQAIEDIAIMNVLPNMTIIAPADDIETKQAIEFAVNYSGPVYIRLGRIDVENVHNDDYNFKLGKGSVIKEGTDIAIFTYGIMNNVILEAISELDVSVKVINMASIKPIDENIINDIAKSFDKIMTIEEHSIIGGLGDIVASKLVGNYNGKFEKIGIKDTFGESGHPDDLMKKHGLDVESLKNKIKNF